MAEKRECIELKFADGYKHDSKRILRSLHICWMWKKFANTCSVSIVALTARNANI